ncbi:hypothetical protein [Streptomyces yaizuensis]|uniref:Thioesterase family protein n=1 Tax=Streptomyces yaizuensis TaxID=2989713 RepID=A0ABQ5P4R1_9ACTN|nr:hypothetical protein [Streptomyces sp. YSPA8]GLF97539.1 hypothetical protein SYYSPA8_24600 [Streptomyces sp. YSPA8]
MPALPEDLIDLIRDLQRQVRRLSTAVAARPALNEITAGDVTITGGGSLVVRNPDKDALLHIGAIGAPEENPPEQGVRIRRADGSLALTVSGKPTQALNIWDRFNRVALADDTRAGGLARPYVPIPLYPAPTRITSGSWTRVLQGGMYLQNPRIAVGLWLQAAANTTVEARVRYLTADGTAVELGDSLVATGEAFTREVAAPHGQPSYSWSNLLIEGRVIAGTGEASLGVLYAEGRQS